MLYRTLRILVTLVSSRFGASASPFEPLRTRLRVWPNEADLKNAHQASIAFMFELGRWDYMVRVGLLGSLVRRRIFPIIAGQHLRYIRPLRRFAAYDLVTHMVYWDARMFFVEHRLERDGKVHARGLVRGIFREGARDIPIEELLTLVGAKGTPPPMPEAVERWRLLDEALHPAAPAPAAPSPLSLGS